MTNKYITENPAATIKQKFCIGVRHMQYVLLFSLIALAYSVRTIWSVAIIAMTQENSPNPNIPTYPEWTNTDVILSSFFWGYIVTQIGAGELAARYGPKWFLVVTMTICSLLDICIPVVAATLGSTGVIVCRMMHGICQGFFIPSIHNLLSKWAPMSERAVAVSVVYGGESFGTAVAMLLTGAYCESNWGWTAVFYLYGVLGLIWSILWALLGANSPLHQRWISEEEKIFITETCIANKTEIKKVPTPWKSIGTSLPTLAIFVALCGQAWVSFTLLAEIPSFMSNLMNFDIKENSQLSTLPYIAQWLMGAVSSPVADKLISKNVFRLVTVRRLFNGISSFVPAIALFMLGFVNDESQKFLAVTLLAIAVAFSILYFSGSNSNPIDLAPNHAGVIMGITNGFSMICAILGPLTVPLLGDDKKDPILWRKVFWLAACISLLTGIFFVWFSSADLQPWNDPEEDKDDTKMKKENVLSQES